MFNVRNGNIYHTRGDTGRLQITIKDESGKTVEGYAAYFSVKKRLKDDEYLFQADVNDGLVIITHEMTRNLPYGDYFFDIEVHTADGDVQTIGPAEYHLLPDVTK